MGMGTPGDGDGNPMGWEPRNGNENLVEWEWVPQGIGTPWEWDLHGMGTP